MAEKKEKISDHLFWLDLEMTGLNPEHDAIIEMASVITNNNLEVIAEGPHFIIHQPEEILALMDAWCVNAHSKSGLTEKVRISTTTVAQAQQQTLEFLRQYCQPQTVPLCGNSVYQDRTFLRKYMPELETFLHYRIIDTSSIKEVVRRWYPKSAHTKFVKKENHRALEDVYASIEELKHYKKYFFV
jgi:oligoribonuclease